jgi:hypothetical protein
MSALQKQGGVEGRAYRKMGFRRTPLAVTMGATDQLSRYLVGEIDLPAWLKGVLWDQPDLELKDPAAILAEQDAGLFEFFTVDDVVADVYFLSTHVYQSKVIGPIAKIGKDEARMARTWLGEGVFKQKEDVRAELEPQVRKLLPLETEADEWLHHAVAAARGRRIDRAERTRMFREVKQRLPFECFMCLHVFRYFADARVISWPPEFIDESMQLARDTGTPIFDPAPIVAEHGTGEVLEPDLRHYRPDRFALMGEEMIAFIENERSGGNAWPEPAVAAAL